MRKCGVLMPVSSLEGPYGIGGFGKKAYQFVDFLAEAGQQIWQLLPLSPTGYGDSPYQSCSAFAGNPYFIDLDTLCGQGLLQAGEYEGEEWAQTDTAVDYGAIYFYRFPVLRKAYARFAAYPPDDYYTFCFENESWLDDYALYMAAKTENGMTSWHQWPLAIRRREPHALKTLRTEHADELGFWKFLQYEFEIQWTALKGYANQKGIQIMGDIPIYVAADSADAWAGGQLFETDENGAPRRVAGCPPDYFSADGQLWGNPLYNWHYHKETGYAWWVRRMRHALNLYDILRIDHFRAFDTYFAINAGEVTARHGVWEQGPGMQLFHALRAQLGELPIVAEDLGLLFDSVRQLLKDSGFPGMKVLQFAFGSDASNEYLPHNHIENCVVYPGTHDNATIGQWLKTCDEAELNMASAYLGLNKKEGLVNGVIRATLASCGRTAIVPMGDWLGLGAQGRMNVPGEAVGNWTWRAKPGAFGPVLAQRMRKTCALYDRTTLPETENE